MANIAVIDDDFACESLVSYLAGKGHEATRYASAQQAMQDLQRVLKSDLVIMDVLMARPNDITEERASGGYLEAIRKVMLS